MFKPLMFSLAALGLSLAQSATAEEFFILMEEGAFYPEITYIAPGDLVTFVNANDSSAEAVSSDESWTTGQLAPGASFMLSIAQETALNFAFASDATIAAAMSFDPAPLSEFEADGTVAADGTEPTATN